MHHSDKSILFDIRNLCSAPPLYGAACVEKSSALPPLQRRRLSELGRAAVDVATQLSCDCSPASPLVFASRYGDMDRSLQLLTQLSDAEALSPTQFGLSVHNAIGAFFSIHHRHTGNYTAIAAGRESTAAAFCEALALLGAGHDEVRVVCYDAPLPETYAAYADAPLPLHAWGCVLSQARQAGFSLDSEPLPSGEGAASASDLLPVLAFLAGTAPALRHPGARCQWVWQRHG